MSPNVRRIGPWSNDAEGTGVCPDQKRSVTLMWLCARTRGGDGHAGDDERLTRAVMPEVVSAARRSTRKQTPVILTRETSAANADSRMPGGGPHASVTKDSFSAR